MPSAKTKRLRDKQRYASAKEDIQAACKDYYAANADKCREVFKRAYASDPKKFKDASKKAYASNLEKFKDASKKAYASDPEKFKEASKKAYASDPEKFLEEINRLCSIYRKDLPLYNIPKNKSSCRKRKFAVNLDEEPPPAKKPCIEKQKPKRKLSLQKESTKSNPPKKSKRDTDTDCVYTGTESGTQHTTWPDLRFFPFNEDWQRQACNILGLEFRGAFNHGHDRGEPDTILTRPDCRSLKRIVGDGNCLFRSLCYIITGSEEQHFALRIAIVQHMLSIPHMFVGYGTDGQPNCISLFCHPHHYESVEEYVRQTRMDCNKVWGINVEMACLAHILRAPVYCYDASQRYHIWAAYFPNSVNRSIPRDVQHRSLYIYFANNHFEVVNAIRNR